MLFLKEIVFLKKLKYFCLPTYLSEIDIRHWGRSMGLVLGYRGKGIVPIGTLQ